MVRLIFAGRLLMDTFVGWAEGLDTRRASGVLTVFYFFKCVSITWTCSTCESLLNSKMDLPAFLYICYTAIKLLSKIHQLKNFFILVDLQCFVSFWCTTKWFSYPFSLRFICRVLNIVPHAIQWDLVDYQFIYSSVCMLIPNS